MHLLARTHHGLDETASAVDLGQSPGELVFLSFSDGDLAALAAAWQAMPAPKPRLRLASLAQLRHPLSVDLYLEQVVAHAKAVVVRLLGGVAYWPYGIEEVAALCARAGIALAVVPGDGRADPALAALSTMPAPLVERLDALMRLGGAANMTGALALAAHAAGLVADDGTAPEDLPPCGEHAFGPAGSGKVAAVVFYRSHLVAGDVAPMPLLADALRARGLAPRFLFVDSLKNPATATFVAERLRAWRPAVVLSATGFSARMEGGASPLDAADAPVLQLVLASTAEAAWAESSRGLGQADLAMQVVLPELDGRLSAAAISFKEPAPAADALEFAPLRHRPHEAGIAQAADRAAGWARLAATPRAARRIMLVLSDYPDAGGQVGHAVGLDGFASAARILDLLGAAGYDAPAQPDLRMALIEAPPAPILGADAYAALFATLPAPLQARVVAEWGEPSSAIHLRHLRAGGITLAVEPGRGHREDRKSGYHDPDLPPCHAYLGFHLWRRHVLDAHALLHLGAHGVLEWLPGKAAALSESCFPQALAGRTPVIYPYIVNNPGEAAAARRRIGAVTIGHLTPPMVAAGLHGEAAVLERRIEEYAAADGLDRRRAALLRTEIIDLARGEGLLAEAGAEDAAPDDALARLDAYLCDLKAMRIGDGLHVFATAPAPERGAAMLATLRESSPDVPDLADRLARSPAEEAAALLAALDGRFVPPGPAGAPTAGRADVLPTGRNLATTDPRIMPTPSALRLARRAAAELLARHRQENGTPLRRLVIDLWGSASLRTGGEDIALALLLLGAEPVWDAASGRVTGVDILPLAVLDRPRVDVTLRISGLFRDAFAAQIALFDQAIRAVAARDEAAEWNPLAGAVGPRVFGAAPGHYGAGVEAMLARGATEGLGPAWLAASHAAYGQGYEGVALPERFAALVAGAEAFVHPQDHGESDLLDGLTHAAHAGGFAAAAASLGAAPRLYHADLAANRVRGLAEQIARVVRGRAAHPAWIAGQMRHAYRGAGEIARAVQGLAAFSATLPDRLDRSFDLLFDATLGDAEVAAFLLRENPAAAADIRARFAAALRDGRWRPRRNDLGDLR